jgi:hypothetical protein
MYVTDVKSSQVKRVAWQNDVMVVTFTNGSVYVYEDVPYKTYKELVEAESVGHYMNESVKYNYQYKRLTD